MRAGRLLRGSTHEVTARLSALALAALLMVSLGTYAVLHFGALDRGPEYRARFVDAWPLVAGMDVRVAGAVAGSVRAVDLNRDGSAEVTFQLRPGVPRPRADASVAVRQVDLLGDTDLELSPGSSPQPLTGAIPETRSIQEPRLDDFLNIFRQPVRVALQTFIVEFGTALFDRGADLNQAVLELRPGFQALDTVSSELRSQIGALGRLVDASHAVSTQLAARTSALDRLVIGLQRTVTGVAGQAPALDAGLARLPPTLEQTRSALGRVQGLTDATAPLARTLVTNASAFQRTARLIAPFAGQLADAARLAAPTIVLAGRALRAGTPGLDAVSRTSLPTLLDPTAGLFSSLTPVLSHFVDGLFGTPHGGGLGGVIIPPGTPGIDPARGFMSLELVITCDTFGVAQAPGCLAKGLQRLTGSPAGGALDAPASASSPAAPAESPAGGSRAATAAPPARRSAARLNPLLRYLLAP